MIRRSALVRYGASVLIIAAVVLVRWLMEPLVGNQSPYVVFLPGIMLSAWYGGFGPGVLASVLTALAADLFFIPPVGGLFDHTFAEALRVHIYFADGLFISWLAGGLRSAVEKSRRNEAELARADRRKDDFLAILGHELRSPLAPLMHGIELLRRSAGEPESAGETVGMMERQIQLMAHLVDDLLDVARIRKGKVALRFEVVPLSEIVSRAVELCEPLLKSRDHKFSLDLPDGPIWVRADPIRLTQVITNLLTNAAKYTPEGGRIALSVRAEQNDVVVQVADNGVGIPADRVPHIFELFHQAEDAPTDAQAGLGLGLAVVRSLVQSHGGRVSARSAGPGRGSEFTIRLPLAAEPEQAEIAQRESISREDGPRPLRVMIVEDNADAADALARLLRFDGHETLVAVNGPEALRKAERWSADVVVLDIGLPGMDGYRVARELRSREGSRRMRLVAMTGRGTPDDLQRAGAAGFDYHLLKPVHYDDLLAVLTERPITRSAGLSSV